MSRSYRHTPICGMTTARSEKSDKQRLNRAWRSRVRQRLTVFVRLDDNGQDAFILPDVHHEILDRWDMAKDGRQWFGYREHPDEGYGGRFPRWEAWGK